MKIGHFPCAGPRIARPRIFACGLFALLALLALSVDESPASAQANACFDPASTSRSLWFDQRGDPCGRSGLATPGEEYAKRLASIRARVQGSLADERPDVSMADAYDRLAALHGSL